MLLISTLVLKHTTFAPYNPMVIIVLLFPSFPELQCHCYVCDSIAPCVHWGTGISNVDHCHATDKQEIWKNQRESFRLGKNAPVSVLKLPDAQLPLAFPQLNQVASFDVIQLPPNLGTQSQPSRPATVRACSSARLPNIISRNRNRRPGCDQSRNRLLPRIVSQQAVSAHNAAVPQDRGQQIISSNTMFKRAGIIRGPFSRNQSMYGIANNKNCAPASHYTRNNVSLAAINAKNPSGWQDDQPYMTSDSYTYLSPTQGSVTSNVVALQPDVYSQPTLQSNDGENIYQNQSQNFVNSIFPDLESDWFSNLSESNHQVSAENIHPHGTGSNNEPTTVKQFSTHFTGSTDLHQKNHDYESWLLGQSDAVVSAGCVPADLNAFSPELSGFDAGMLCFDF